jgi:16S rRNA (uracil1498-N3)-methyltransferase
MSENQLIVPGGKLRLYVEAPLAAGLRFSPAEQQAHYLIHVMRAKAGDRVCLFNGRDGEWSAQIVEVSKRSCTLGCDRKIAEQSDVPDVWLCFAPIKKSPGDYVVQKATELGVRILQPVFTHRTIVSRVNPERMRANAIEAAEQSGRLSIPETRQPLSLEGLVSSWPKERRLIFCDEGGAAIPIATALSREPELPFAILTGPEGGFDSDERKLLRGLPFVVPVSLGPRILRADTAALAALAIWQTVLGDWQ